MPRPRPIPESWRQLVQYLEMILAIHMCAVAYKVVKSAQ
jgi:hypothetical protein